jgi:hypothetical protein
LYFWVVIVILHRCFGMKRVIVPARVAVTAGVTYLGLSSSAKLRSNYEKKETFFSVQPHQAQNKQSSSLLSNASLNTSLVSVACCDEMEIQEPSTGKSFNERINNMIKMFPDCSVAEVKRFLVARNGDVEHAAKMLQNSIEWRSSNLPLDVRTASSVLDRNCCIIHGEDADGDPVIYFRWGKYDATKADPATYVLMICHLMNYVFETQNASRTTVFVDLSVIPGEVNGYADMAFIQHAIKVCVLAALSLRRLLLIRIRFNCRLLQTIIPKD